MKDINNIVVKYSTSIKETMATIDTGAIRMALVVDENFKLVGLVTDGDIRRAIVKGISIDDEVKSIMNKKPIIIKKGLTKNEIIYFIKNNDKNICFPIVNNDDKLHDLVIPYGDGFINYEKNLIEKKVDKVLILGGAGFIGSVLTKLLLDKGYKVKVLDKFMYNEDSLKSFDNKNLEIIKGDIRHVEDVTEAAKGVDAVIHLAELVGDPACAFDTKITLDINHLATRIVASVCKYYQINRLVYMSSCSVYGASKCDELLTENSNLFPVSLYAKMKIESEKTLLEMIDNNFSPTILRLSTVYGMSYRPRFDLVVNTLSAKAIQDGKITIFGGDQWRPNVHVSDVAKAIMLVIESPIKNVAGEIFNVGSEKQNFTINKIGEIIKQEIPEAELVIEDKDVDKRNYKVDFTKIRETIGFIPDKTISEAVNEIKKAFADGKIKDYTDKKYSNIKCLQENS